MTRVRAFPDYYRVLGVSPTAGPDEIKSAFRRAAKMHHPDHNAPANKAQATAHFQLIAEAYEVLGDPARRFVYDACRAVEARQRRVRPGPPVMVRIDVSVPAPAVWLIRFVEWVVGERLFEPISRPGAWGPGPAMNRRPAAR